MNNQVPILPAVGQAVRGLSALFWGLPLALLACAKVTLGETWRVFGGFFTLPFRVPEGWRWLFNTVAACLPALAALLLVLLGLRMLSRFQSQERPWRAALDRARIFNLLLLALTPFAYWWNLAPREPMFFQSVTLFALAGIGFLLTLNQVLARLALMIPDEVLRSDTRLFSRVNRHLILLLGALFLMEIAGAVLGTRLPLAVLVFLNDLSESRHLLLVVLALLPTALTMTLLWRAKETLFASVFRADR